MEAAGAPPRKPGQAAVAVAVGGGARMPPPPPRAPKRKDVVLDEDDWTATLEAIIERDFFPELPKLESKVAWLQAIRSGDPEQIRQAQLLIAQRRAAAAAGGRPLTGAPLFTPGGTAARAVAGDTPFLRGLPPGVPAGYGGGRAGTGNRPATTTGGGGVGYEEEEGPAVAVAPPVSLDSFLAVHTSEDNASFKELLDKTNKKRRLKAAAQLAPPPDPKLLITDGREKTDGFGSTGQAPSTLVTWPYQPKNALYYDGGTREVLPYSDSELAAQVQGAPKVINHNATRFPREEAGTSASATPSISGVSGGSSAAGGGGGGAEGPRGGGAAAAAGVAGTRGYDVLATPSFDPGAGGNTPLMTWGDIEGTPMRIEAEDLPPGPMYEGGPSFFIKEGTQREQRSHALSSRAAVSLRSRRGAPRGSTAQVTTSLAAAAAVRRPPTGSIAGLPARPGTAGARPPTGPGGARPLSQAARRLASSLHKGSAVGGDDLGLRASYRGPSPSRRAGSAAATPSAGSGGWSAANTPAGTPRAAVHAKLEEEELRVQALMRARQVESEKGRQLEAARAEAQQGFQAAQAQQWEAQQQQQPGSKQVQGPPPKPPEVGGGGEGDLTAGLLDI